MSADEVIVHVHVHERTGLLLPATATASATTLLRIRWWLYTSHLFAQGSDNLWQFSIVLVLAALSNYNSLMLVSTYGLMTGLFVCYWGSSAGHFVDTHNRLYVAQVFILTENVCVVLATVVCYILLARDTEQLVEQNDTTTQQHGTGIAHWIQSRFDGVPSDPFSVVLLLAIHLFGAAAQILATGFTVAIERDWIVVMSNLVSKDQQSTWLSETNIAMKQIDLACKIGAPAMAGFIMSAAMNQNSNATMDHGRGMRGVVVLVGVINIMALVVEYTCTYKIYHLIPELAVTARERKKVEDPATNSAIQVPTKETQEELRGCGFLRLPSGLRIYLNQPIALGGIGYALLYLNALTFGGLMTAYLVWRGMRFDSVGVWRGISSAIGLLGTVIYHLSVKVMSIESTGMWSITFQFVCLSVSYASLFVEDLYTSLAMLIAGVCASRIGLWVFDISITQLMQECVPAEVRGVTGGVQQSLNAFFGLLAFVLGIVFPDPRKFYIYVSAGYASVCISMVIYAIGIYLRQDKLRI